VEAAGVEPSAAAKPSYSYIVTWRAYSSAMSPECSLEMRGAGVRRRWAACGRRCSTSQRTRIASVRKSAALRSNSSYERFYIAVTKSADRETREEDRLAHSAYNVTGCLSSKTSNLTPIASTLARDCRHSRDRFEMIYSACGRGAPWPATTDGYATRASSRATLLQSDDVSIYK
jgi:hypothetical protein